MNPKVREIVDSWSDIQKVTLAAELLNGTDYTTETLQVFFDELNMECHDALCEDAADQEPRADSQE